MIIKCLICRKNAAGKILIIKIKKSKAGLSSGRCEHNQLLLVTLTWALGIWGSIILMLPASLISSDPVFKVFGILNFLLFSGVLFVVLKFR